MTRRRGLLGLLAACVLSCALFAALGAWQVQRMGWKHDLVERITARVRAAPQPPPGPPEWAAVQADPRAWEYRRLQLQGEYLHEAEALVQASTVQGAGFWVVVPLRLTDGSIVLVNRGFVPPDRRDPARRNAAAPPGPARVTGLVRITEPGGGFLRDNDPAANRWHSRDVAAIAAARGLPADRVAPFFVDAEATPAGQWPVGGLTVLRFPDNHLAYALTWFTLAAMAAGGAVFLVRGARQDNGRQ